MRVRPLSFTLIASPLSNISVTICVDQPTVARCEIFFEPALVDGAIGPDFLSFAMRDVCANYNFALIFCTSGIMILNLLEFPLLIPKLWRFALVKREVRLLNYLLHDITPVAMVLLLVV